MQKVAECYLVLGTDLDDERLEILEKHNSFVEARERARQLSIDDKGGYYFVYRATAYKDNNHNV